VEALRDRDTVIMIDEADYLSDSSLELVRRVINDKAQTGVVLVGSHVSSTNLRISATTTSS
jgi:DNA transposition AAA+ family ATPase